jgi:hypothetical protein
MVEITYQMVLSTLQTLSLGVGVIYYIMTLQNTRRNQQLTLETRQAQLMMQIYQELISEANLKTWNETMSWEFEDFDDFERKYSDPDSFAKRYSVMRMFDGVGLLLRDGLLDVDKVYDLIDSAVLQQWRKWGPIVKETRTRYPWPDAEEGFEYLYDEMMKVRRKRGITEDFTIEGWIQRARESTNNKH